MIIVAAEEGSKGIGRIRLRRIPDTTRMSLHGFIEQAIEPGSTVRTDGLNAYLGLKGYVHDRRVQRRQPGDRQCGCDLEGDAIRQLRQRVSRHGYALGP